MFTKQEALKKECRVVPMLVLPAQIAGQLNVIAPNCSADNCMHWRWLEEPSALDATKLGGCALDADVASAAFSAGEAK